MDTSLQFEIPSDLAKAREVQSRILEAIEPFHYAPDDLWGIRLALEEALINAIKHGNKCDCAKKVKVEAIVNADRVEIEIEDQGAGFRRCDVPDPTAEENIHRVHGRGILLMEAYMNEVRYSRGGRRVHMVRRNSAAALDRARPASS